MGYLGSYAGAFLGAYLGSVDPVEVVEPFGFADYIGVLELRDPDPLGWRAALAGEGYRGELAPGGEHVGILAGAGAGFDYRGALAPTEDTIMSFSMIVGDRLPSLTRICLNAETGEAVDLTGATAVSRFKIGEDGELKTGTVVVTDDEAGEVRCDWASGDIDAEGICYLRVVATIGGKAMTFPSDGSWFTFPVGAAT